MNTNRIHQIRTATFTTIVAFIACASTASPTFAGESHDNGEGRLRNDSASPVRRADHRPRRDDAGPVPPEPPGRRPPHRDRACSQTRQDQTPHGPRHQSGAVLGCQGVRTGSTPSDWSCGDGETMPGSADVRASDPKDLTLEAVDHVVLDAWPSSARTPVRPGVEAFSRYRSWA